MAINIGIDTGGTYTDAVVFDTESKRVLAKSKARTTKEDLSLGIAEAFDKLPAEYFGKVQLVVLSTTLATNACVEGKGSRSKLVLMGTNESVLRRINAAEKYGLSKEAVLCVPMTSSFDGGSVEHPNWDALIASHEEWFADADAFAVCERNAVNNGATCEHEAERVLAERFSVPVVLAIDLAKHLNMMERGATALLNARLLPVIEEFLRAVDGCLIARGISRSPMILRSDGGIMRTSLSKDRPVETILSGPAASVCGASELATGSSCMVVDMGGTTTDLALVLSGKPQMDDKTRIGSWRTQVEGVRVDTFSLGGDTRVVFKDGSLDLSSRRVEPISAAVMKHPMLLDKLKALAARPTKGQLPLFEALYLVKEPADKTTLTDQECATIADLRQGPVLLDQVDLFALNVERLESEGYIMRCGFTPTDAMHVKGDFDLYNTEAARLCAEYIAGALPCCPDGATGIEWVCNEVYELVEHRMFTNILRSFIIRRYPELSDGNEANMLDRLVELQWQRAREDDGDSYFSLGFSIDVPLVGMGAPIHLFLPKVARLLGARYEIPEHAEVANAVGAAAARVTACARVTVMPVYDSFGIVGYRVHTARDVVRAATRDEALALAREAARAEAYAEALDRGSAPDASVEIEESENTSRAGDGQILDLGTIVTAHVDCTIK